MIHLMKLLLDESVRENREKGFVICENMEVPRICTGEACHVRLEDCAPGKIVGDFHTHPGGTEGQSVGDWSALAMSDIEFSCVGFIRDGKPVVRCTDVFEPEEETMMELDSLAEEGMEVLEEIFGPPEPDVGITTELMKKGYRLNELAREYPEYGKIYDEYIRLSRLLETDPCEVELTEKRTP